MSSSPQSFSHISKNSKLNDKTCSTPLATYIFSKYQCPLSFSPPNVNPKINKVCDQLLYDQIKSSPKRLFFDHSSRMLIDTPSLDSNGTHHRFFVSLNPPNSLKKEEVVTSLELEDQKMKEVLSLYPEKKFFESMVEMVRTRLECNLIVDSDYLEELLALYLIHNEEYLYDHIFSAYLHVMVDLSHTFG